jgi:wyosine [tRNA(Phe)-imidazoG37] synthetase (radical SAM superfamily)
MQVRRQKFYEPGFLVQVVRDKSREVIDRGETIDYLTFVPDGEPTLDINLGSEIQMLRGLDIPIAVISNASLIAREDVRSDLLGADWVSLKVDAVRPALWKQVDRPHGHLELHQILDGIIRFADTFEGTLATETMLIRGLNDGEPDLLATATFLEKIHPDVAYLAIPTRPPAEAWVHASGEETIHRAYHQFSRMLNRVELLIGYEGNAFASSGDAEADLLSIMAVHPMREDAVHQLLDKDEADWVVVDHLLEERKLVELEYEGQRFYLRRIPR